MNMLLSLKKRHSPTSDCPNPFFKSSHKILIPHLLTCFCLYRLLSSYRIIFFTIFFQFCGEAPSTWHSLLEPMYMISQNPHYWCAICWVYTRASAAVSEIWVRERHLLTVGRLANAHPPRLVCVGPQVEDGPGDIVPLERVRRRSGAPAPGEGRDPLPAKRLHP